MKKIFLFILITFYFKANAQVIDNFSDGDFNSNPSWAGDIGGFQINPNLQLQTNLSASAQSVYLSTANISLNNTLWTFDFQMNFDPSTGNQMRIYLASNNADLENSLNGYFLLIGESGNTDSYDLFRQTGTTITKIIDGAPHIRSVTDTVKSQIRISRDNLGLWTLESDDTFTNNFQLEGTVNDATHSISSFFGVRAIYTATRSDKFIFDNLSISVLAADTTPPNLISAATNDGIKVQLNFNEALEGLSALNISNYTISGIGNPIIVAFSGANNSVMELELAQELAVGNYLVTVSNVKDLAGNTISVNNTANFTYSIVVTNNSIVINELFADPSPTIGLPATEFAELYNTSNQPVNLNGFKYSDATSTYTFGNTIINGGEYLILTTRADTNSYKIYGDVLGLTTFPSLNNTGDSISLKDNTGIVIDQVNYNLNWYRSTVKANGGYTLERIDPFSICKNYQNWNSSNANIGGTPGKVNSVFDPNLDLIKIKPDSIIVIAKDELRIILNKVPDSSSISTLQNYRIVNSLNQEQGILSVNANNDILQILFQNTLLPDIYKIFFFGISDCAGGKIDSLQFYTFEIQSNPISSFPIIINEIFADPSPVIGLPEKEFIELFNTSNSTVLLNGLEYSDPTSTFIFTNGSIDANSYLIICPIADTALFSPFGKVKGISPFPSLNNAGDVLSLTDPNGTILNKVTYADSWYRDAIKKGGGYSLEKIDPFSNCNQAENWNASNSIIGGTPGIQNSVFAINTDTAKLKIVSLTAISATELLISFSKIPDTTAAKMISNYQLIDPFGTIVLINIITNDNGNFILTINQNLIIGNYKIKLKNITDCGGNEIDTSQFNFTISGIPTGEITLLINELYPDPDVSSGLPNAEFIELYNFGIASVALKGVTFSDASSTATFKGGSISEKGFAIVCDISDVSLFAAYPNVIGVSSFPSLNNASDFVVLKDKIGNTIDQLSYTDDWYRDPLKSDGGFTLERIDEFSTCSGLNNWKASENILGGTPGFINSVNAPLSDTTTLRITNVKIENDSSVTLTFSKSVNQASLVETFHFVINGFIQLNSTLPSADNTSVTLTFSSKFIRGFTYNIQFFDFADCTGKPVSINPVNVLLALPVNIGDLLINEILFNPKTGGSDFVEIYNNSENVIDLSEINIANATDLDSVGSEKQISNNQFFLMPKKYAVLSPNIQNIISSYFTENNENFIQIASMPSLNDDEGRVILLSKNRRIDQYNYSDKDHFPLLDNTEGVSLERISFGEKTQNKSNWNSAATTVGFATPGYKNSQARELKKLEDEIQIEPQVFSPDGDGRDDELIIRFNINDANLTANITVFDMEGRKIKKIASNDLIAETGTYSWKGEDDDNQKVKAGVYIVYFETFALDGDIKKFKKTCVLANKF